MENKVIFKQINSDETLELRHLVLRPNKKPEELKYPNDNLSFHGGAVLNGKIIGIASVYPEPKPGEKSSFHWRLRGMGVLPEFQGKGYGASLLDLCIDFIKSNEGKLLWCNARFIALGFYLKLGFKIVSDSFEIEDIGVHYIMEKEL